MPTAAAWSVALLSCALGACSVYSEDLVDEAALGGDEGGTNGSGGSSAGSGGKVSSGGGGKSSSGMAGTGALPSSGSGGDGEPGGTGAHGGESPSGGTAGSDAGGGSGSAGSGSVGGSTGGTPPVNPMSDLLDGFEDADLTLEQTAGRGGVWYLYDDGTVGTAGPSPLAASPLLEAPAALGSYAMHITATGFTSWGSGLGVDFRAGKKVYDGSQHSGIRFWARVGEGKNTRHRLQFADGTTDALGGKCNAALDAPDGEKCEDHFGTNQTFTTTWTQYEVPFSALSQLGWGNAATELDKTTLYGMQITAKAKLEVDLWLDQIEFF